MTDEREQVESMTLQALISFPRLGNESGITPDHFRSNARRKALYAALLATPHYNGDGSAPLADLAARSGVDREWLASQLTARFETADQGRHWVHLLANLEASLRLRLRIEDAFAKSDPADVADVVSLVLGEHQRKYGAINGHGISDMQQIAERFIDDEMEALTKGRPRAAPIGLAFPRLSRALKGGWRPGELTLLLAAGGCGKSTLIEQWRAAMAQRSLYSILFSAEMTKEQLAERLVQSEAMVPMAEDLRMQDLQLASEQLRRKGYAKFLKVDRQSTLVPERVLGITQAQIAQLGAVGLIVGDHLGLSERRMKLGRENRHSGGAEDDLRPWAVQQWKAIAMSCNVPAVLIGHMRKDESAKGKEPGDHLIRGGSLLTDICDNELIMWTDEDGATWLRIAKARMAGIRAGHSKIKMAFDARTQTYSEVESYG